MDWKRLAKQDFTITALVFILLILGVLSVFTNSYFGIVAPPDLYIRQMLFALGGLTLYQLIILVNPNWYRQRPLLFGSWLSIIGILTLLLITGLTIANTQRWITFLGLQFQPAEFFKLATILITAHIVFPRASAEIQRVDTEDNQPQIPLPLRRIIVSGIAVVPGVILILLQPALGNAMITISIWTGMIMSLHAKVTQIWCYLAVMIPAVIPASRYVLGYTTDFEFQYFVAIPVVILVVLVVRQLAPQAVNFRLWLIICVGILTAVASWGTGYGWETVVNDYQKQRITSFLDPSDPQGANYQVNKANIAIASAGILGYGILEGPQLINSPIPDSHTDFAFASWVEQLGIVGGVILLSLQLAIIWKVVILTGHTQDNYSKLVGIGVALSLLINVVIHTGMNMALLPVTGVPLPLISYGGSNLLMNMISLGIVQSLVINSDLHHISSLKFNTESA